jgi:hypothetical protein
MADRVGELSRIVVDRYGGNADSIWASAQDGRELLARVRELPGFGEQKAKIFVALLGKQLGARPTGWRDAAGAFGEEGSRLSIADIADAESLAAVRAHKAAVKAAAKSLAGLEHDAGGGGSGNARAGRGKAGKPAAAAAPSTKSGARTAKAPAARAATSRRA